MGAKGLRSEKVVNGMNQYCYPSFVVSYLRGFDGEEGIFLQNILS